MSVSSARSQPQQFSDFGRGSNLRDDVTFPVYADCPHENDIYLPYYKANHLSGIFKAARHWCFIGQVVDAFYMFRLTLVVRDKDGHDVSVWFYDDDRGSRFMDGRNCNVMGHTFVLLYAQRHPFMDGSEGFRIEEPEAIKVRDTTKSYSVVATP